MDTKQLQAKVADFVRRHGRDADVEARLLDLVSEVGELSKEALKGSIYGRDALPPTGAWVQGHRKIRKMETDQLRQGIQSPYNVVRN